MHSIDKLAEAFRQLIHDLRNEIICPRSHGDLVTKQDLEEMEKRIMSQVSDLIAAINTLSTSADGLSVKVDTLITTVDAAVVVLQNEQLSPEGEAALAKVKAATSAAGTEGDKVDAEIAKMDTILPTPAPAAPTA